jgi:hypothetical protein
MFVLFVLNPRMAVFETVSCLGANRFHFRFLISKSMNKLLDDEPSAAFVTFTIARCPHDAVVSARRRTTLMQVAASVTVARPVQVVPSHVEPSVRPRCFPTYVVLVTCVLKGRDWAGRIPPRLHDS